MFGLCSCLIHQILQAFGELHGHLHFFHWGLMQLELSQLFRSHPISYNSKDITGIMEWMNQDSVLETSNISLGIQSPNLRMVMEAKHLVEEVIVHPNHPLTRSLDPKGMYVYIIIYLYIIHCVIMLVSNDPGIFFIKTKVKQERNNHPNMTPFLYSQTFMIEGRKDMLDKSLFMIEPCHRENGGGTLWDGGPLNSEGHIKLVVRGYLLDPNPLLKGLLFWGSENQRAGAPIPRVTNHFPYDPF